MRILVVEDNPDIAANIMDFLEASGYSPDHAPDGICGMHLALTQRFDVIVLDLMLPGMDGLTLCSHLRERGDSTPILMLTARDTLPDKVAGFDAGTDDYLVKPFALKELFVRIRALGQRNRSTSGQVLRVADLELNLGTFEVTRAGRPLELNKVGTRILQCLMEASPNVVTRDELTWQIWQDQPPGSDALRSHIYHLRQVVDKPFPTHLLQTLRGVGYRLVSSHESQSRSF